MNKISQYIKRVGKIGVAGALLSCTLAVATPAHADRLAEIKARGTLVCATLANNEPLGFSDPQTRQVVGFDVDICAAVARQLGVEMEQKSVTVEARIPMLVQGEVDLVSAALGYTRERARLIDFTASHYQNPIKIVVQSDSGLNMVADLADKRISANRNSTPEEAVHRVLPKAAVQTFSDTPQAFLALAQGKVDGLAISMPSGIRFVTESAGRFRFVEGALAWEPTALGVKKGEHKLLAAVNQALSTMEKEGELDAIWSKWFGPKTKFNIPRDKKLTPIAKLR
ncbi:MAG: ABC transporter substrate-binding protein [Herbaspirillum sp.]|nr:ABC transporter substrate-binding protein [Herbaspirillum sp.]